MQSDRENMLLVDSVQLAFGDVEVLKSAFLTVKTGRVTGVLGRNGSGKSCLFESIMGGKRPQNIFIRINDEQSIDHAHIGERVKFLPQRNFIQKNFTLNEVFKLYGVDFSSLEASFESFKGAGGKTPRDLSGGEQRIAEMYLILKSECEFCILDEPFSNIAPVYVEKMTQLIEQEKKRKGIVVSDHMWETIIEIADDLFLLKDGYTIPIKSREDLVFNGYINF